MIRSPWYALAVVAAASCAVACDAGSGCSDTPCADGVQVFVAPESHLWQAGDYELTVTHDGVTAECGFKLPDDLPTASAIALFPCGAVVSVSLVAGSDCTDTCTLNNQFELDLSFATTPANLSVELSRDGTVVLSDSRDVVYKEIFPGGSQCGGSCQRAQLDLKVAP